MRRVNTQVDGHRGDSLIGSGNTISLCLNLLPDLIEICELFTLTVEELGILCRETAKGQKQMKVSGRQFDELETKDSKQRNAEFS